MPRKATTPVRIARHVADRADGIWKENQLRPSLPRFIEICVEAICDLAETPPEARRLPAILKMLDAARSGADTVIILKPRDPAAAPGRASTYIIDQLPAPAAPAAPPAKRLTPDEHLVDLVDQVARHAGLPPVVPRKSTAAKATPTKAHTPPS